MHYLSYRLRYDVDSLKLMELGRVVRLDELRHGDLPKKKDTIDAIKALDLKSMPDYLRDNLFLQLYEQETFRQQYFEKLISFIKPSQDSLAKLGE